MRNPLQRVKKGIKEATKETIKEVHLLLKKNEGFGLNELLGTAAALILAAFVVIPGLQEFGKIVLKRLGEWWTGTVAGRIFPPS